MSAKQIIFFLTSLFLLVGALSTTFAQSVTIKGVVQDTITNKGLSNAGITILNAKDSILVKHNWSLSDGSFVVNNLQEGSFIVLISYPYYADYVQHIYLDTHKTVDLGMVKLQPMAVLIQDVIIKGVSPLMKIVGDTIEYNAKSLIIEPNSKVEDLLRQISGLQIDNNGKITAFGQKVNKVLVDGEEFFGDDPTLVTRNIRGDMVDKIQLFDKKSDQASFTGIEDGILTKTLNIKLKEDSKKGYFGKLTGSGGNKEYFETQGMFNAFKNKSKFAVYGNMANTGKVGLSSSENDSYGINRTVFNIFRDGIIASLNIVDDQELNNERYNGQGNPSAKTAGIHYDVKWNNDKASLNTNYNIGSITVDGFKNSIRKNEILSGYVGSIFNQDFNNYAFKQKLDLTYLVVLDPMSTLKVMMDGIIKNNETENDFSNFTVSDNNLLLNQGSRTLNLKGDHKQFNFNALYNKKFRKNRRTFSWLIGESSFDYNSAGFLYNFNEFFNLDGTLKETELVDQYKVTKVSSDVLSSSMTFTEPLSATTTISLKYSIGYNQSWSQKKSFNPTSPGLYDDIDLTFSNDFKLSELNNQMETSLIYNKKNSRVNVGSSVIITEFNQTDLFNSNKYRRNFLNITSSIRYSYSLPGKGSISGGYNGRILQPTIEQIQPVSVNNDPLNIFVGNPLLKPAFNNSFNIFYTISKPLKKSSLNVDGSYFIINNAIVNEINISPEGKAIFSARNLADKSLHNINLRAFYLKSANSYSYMLDLQYQLNNNYSFNNDILNKWESHFLTANFKFYKSIAKKYDITTTMGPTYVESISLRNKLNNSGFGFTGDLLLNVHLPAKLSFSSNLNYKHQGRTEAFDKSWNILLLNSAINKKFFKQESFKLSLSANDLLGQNRGFNRAMFGTTITQTSYSTIQRYFLASLTWDFNKLGNNHDK